MSEPELWEKGVRKTPLSHCLQCGYKLNAGSSVEQPGLLPGPGDVVVCMKCGAVMKYADDMTVRGMSDAEMDELINDKEWMDAIARVVQRVHFIKHASG
jgi:Zn ribbon nucleic-acid-binding protein